MYFLWTRMKLVVEPSGAVAPAGVLAGDAGGRVGVIISGGNVDVSAAAELFKEYRTNSA
jgi:threonine dehydratase